jgi:hypothetical protein
VASDDGSKTGLLPRKAIPLHRFAMLPHFAKIAFGYIGNPETLILLSFRNQ